MSSNEGRLGPLVHSIHLGQIPCGPCGPGGPRSVSRGHMLCGCCSGKRPLSITVQMQVAGTLNLLFLETTRVLLSTGENTPVFEGKDTTVLEYSADCRQSRPRSLDRLATGLDCLLPACRSPSPLVGAAIAALQRSSSRDSWQQPDNPVDHMCNAQFVAQFCCVCLQSIGNRNGVMAELSTMLESSRQCQC